MFMVSQFTSLNEFVLYLCLLDLHPHVARFVVVFLYFYNIWPSRDGFVSFHIQICYQYS